MKKLTTIVFALAAMSAGLAVAQEVAGRVLVVAGDMTILRGSERIAARIGTEVRAGDTLQVGAQSNAQVLLSDQSIFSLRPETTMKLAEYAFQNKTPDTQRAFFELVKGGMRTLSGIIGKARPENYGVTTKTSTIGIRGTHYSIVVCADNCRSANGALAENGTYGAVTDGRISVTNQTGETIFGANQYFRVASQNARPDQLVAPPAFLRDTLEGRAKARQTGSEKTEQQAATTPSGDANITSTVSNATAPVTLAAAVSLTEAATATQGPAAVIKPTDTGTVFYRAAGMTVPEFTCGNPPCNNILVVSIVLAVNLGLQRADASANFVTDSGKAFNLGSPALAGAAGIPLTISNGKLTFSQTFKRVDYPQNQDAFRCADCGADSTVGFLDSLTISGDISGPNVKLVLTGTDAGGGGGFAVDLTQATPPNSTGAALVIPNSSGSDAVASSSSLWGVTTDTAGKLLGIASVGWGQAAAANSINVLIGSAPSAGNLVWGHWLGQSTGGADVTDFDYNAYTTGLGSSIPWITGTVPNTLPPSLGVLSYAPIGSFVNGGSGTLNSGSLTADFVNRVLSVSLNATNSSSGNVFQMNGTTAVSAISSRFGAGFTSVTCAGSCAGGTSGNYSGFFAGANAEGAGVAFSAGDVAGGVNGVVAFKR
jgi:hypothetical protein